MIIEMGSNQFQAQMQKGVLMLNIVEGPANETYLEVPRNGVMTIGRKPTNTINFIDDQHLSNNHATISHQDGLYYIEDNNTTNGTW